MSSAGQEDVQQQQGCSPVLDSQMPAHKRTSPAVLSSPPNALLWIPLPLITYIFPPIGHMGVSDSSGASFEFAGPYFVPTSKNGRLMFGPPARYLPLDPCKATFPLKSKGGPCSPQACTVDSKATPAKGGCEHSDLPTAKSEAAAAGGGHGMSTTAAASEGSNAVRRLPSCSAASVGSCSVHSVAANAVEGGVCGEASPQAAWDHSLRVVAGYYSEYENYSILTNNCHAFVSTFMNLIGYGGKQSWNQLSLAAWMFFAGRYNGIGGFLHTWLPFSIIIVVCGYFGRLIFLYCWVGMFGVLLSFYSIHTAIRAYQRAKRVTQAAEGEVPAL